MKKISELKRILAKNLGYNKARIDCLAKMLIALFSVKKVNLSEMAVAFMSRTKVSSRYKRLQRFFRYFEVDYEVLAKWIFGLFVFDKKVYITIDRTNWFLGKLKINILVLGIAYEGVAIPLLWNTLDKSGNASAEEHISIIKRFVKLFGTKCIAGILADREFGSVELFGWLKQNQIPFYIRIKDGSIASVKGKKLYPVKKLFNQLRSNQSTTFGMDVEIYKQTVFLAGSRSERGELMVVATNCHPKNAVAIYLRRWEIETLFSCLKNRGFYFEATRLVHLYRIEKLMMLLTIGLSWAHKVGEWQAEKKPIRFSVHRDYLKRSIRPQSSYFRYGLDFIREIILSPFKKDRLSAKCLNTLHSPLRSSKLYEGDYDFLSCAKLLKLVNLYRESRKENLYNITQFDIHSFLLLLIIRTIKFCCTKQFD